jgi:DNA (cytosine-5)-methyltransferase 1
VFVVGCLGDWGRAAQVLFERESVQRDSSSRRTPREGAAGNAEGGVGAGRWWDGTDCAGTLTKQNAGGGQRMPDKDNLGAVLQPIGATEVSDSLVARNNQTTGFHTDVVATPIAYRGQNNRDGLQQDDAVAALRASAGSLGFHEINHPVVAAFPINAAHAAVVNMQGSKSNACVSTDGTSFTLNAMHGHDVHAVAVGFNWQNGGGYGNANEGLGITVEGTGPLQRCNTPAVAFSDTSATLKGGSGERGYPDPSDENGHSMVGTAMTVRRLTARECERLQAFPDDYTLIPWRKKQAEDCPDGPRYKALGNSMAVNCMAWIGERIAALENNR